MSKFEITVVVEASSLSLALNHVLWDGDGEPNEYVRAIKNAERVND